MAIGNRSAAIKIVFIVFIIYFFVLSPLISATFRKSGQLIEFVYRLLYFLNEYKAQNLAFEKLKAHWTNIVYKLPKTSEKGYNGVKNGRYNALSRMKKIFDEFVVEQPSSLEY